MNGMLCRVCCKACLMAEVTLCSQRGQRLQRNAWEGKSLTVTQFGKARSLIAGGYLCMYNTGPVLYLKDVIEMHRKLYKS